MMFRFFKRYKRPQAIAVTFYEGGEWREFPVTRVRDPSVHSILFDDGSMWDAHNGWRSKRFTFPSGQALPVGFEWLARK